MNKFSTLMKTLYEEKGSSYGDQAKSIGVSKTHLYEMCNGKSTNPEGRTIAKIVQFYTVSANKVISTLTEDMEAESMTGNM